MTRTNQIKILDKKIMQNEAQYDLDRKAAKISALSSNKLDKYEYLTGEDLGLKPNTIEQAKFKYSPLGKIFNKGLDKDEKKEGLFKRLDNIKDKNEEQLQVIKDQGEKQLKELENIEKNKTLKAINETSKKHDEANKLLPKFLKLDGTIENVELVCTKTDETKYDFNRFSLPLKFIAKIHNYGITLNKSIEDQTKLRILINKLNNEYNPRSLKKLKEKQRVLESARILSDARDEFFFFFFWKKELFSIKVMYLKQKKKKNQKKTQKKTEFLNILRMNQKLLNMICLNNILIV